MLQAVLATLPFALLVAMTAFQEREVREGRYVPPAEGVSLLMLIRAWMRRETG